MRASSPRRFLVTIATPAGAHFEPALAALRAGQHVIGEKPLEITTARIDKMIAAAAASGWPLAAIREGREPGTSAREARDAVALIQALYHSAAGGGVKSSR